MFCVGEVDDKAKELIRTTYHAWQVRFTRILSMSVVIVKRLRGVATFSLPPNVYLPPNCEND